jgi:hypothetical protein
MTRRLIRNSKLFADSTCQLECHPSSELENILIVFSLSWNCSYRDLVMSQLRWLFPLKSKLKLEKGDQPKSTQESSCLKNRHVGSQNVIFSNDLVVKKYHLIL